MRGTRQLRLAHWWWAAGFVLAAVVIVTSLMPSSSASAAIGDKLAHFVAYAALTFWFAGILERERYPVLALLLLALGVAIELAQYQMGLGRTAEWPDIAANSLGIVTAFAFAYAGLGAWMLRVERRLGLS
jgi:VanZ family protein